MTHNQRQSTLTVRRRPGGITNPYSPEWVRLPTRRGDAVTRSNAELLALILLDDSAGEAATRDADQLLSTCGGLTGLVMSTDTESAAGLIPRTTLRMAAALELGRRLLLEPAPASLQICSAHDIGPRLVAEMADLEQECLRVVLLNTKNRVLSMPTIYVGTVSQITVRACEVFREAVRQNATSLIVAHNHPSGDATPSPEDVAITRALVQAGQVIDIAVLDHLVIARGGYMSLRERGLGFD